MFSVRMVFVWVLLNYSLSCSGSLSARSVILAKLVEVSLRSVVASLGTLNHIAAKAAPAEISLRGRSSARFKYNLPVRKSFDDAIKEDLNDIK